jgi:uncharacterized membrane protein
MKALFLSFALLVCVFFSMSAFTVAKHRPHKTAAKTVTWPITGTHGNYSYTITGSGTAAAYIQFSTATNSYGPFTFTQQIGSNVYYTVIPASSPVHATITGVDVAVYTFQEGYVITWHPDL